MEKYEPTDQDLIRWVGAWETETEVNDAGYYFRSTTATRSWRVRAGQVVVIHSHGKLRRGIVVSVGRSNAKVALTTPSAIEEHRARGYELHRVAGEPVPFGLVAGTAGPPEMVDGTFSQTTELEDVCGCDRNPLGHTKAQHPSKLEDPAPASSEPESAEPAPAGQTTGSDVVATLEQVWEAVRANHSDLPAVVIVTGSGFVGPPRWGHFRANGWAERGEKGAALDLVLGEMFVAGETLARGAAHTVETILHEAAHVLAKVRDVKDTSRQGRWHNQRFRVLAEEMGLEYLKETAHPQAGFSECLMTPGTRDEYAPVIEELDRAIRMTVALPEFLATAGDGEEGSGGEFIHGAKKPRKEGTGSTTNNLKAVCGCATPRIIRASRKVLEEGDIVCGKCREPFEAEAEAAKFEHSDEDE